ncbi:uncharacterized protein PRCAT00000531001 [Priceomyces carsonii]|uniref:uncharacterized protein n=1 Tax=Priceomyces carsonii TaxID=28549 RepID=UPI002ED81406|nr:unnamed protein product [Priceomyces carsonii]
MRYSALLASIAVFEAVSAASSEIAPSSFVYSNSSITRAPYVTSSSIDSGLTIYDDEIITESEEYDLYQTICPSGGVCYTTIDEYNKTTRTTIVDDILTVLTTVYPVSSSEGFDDSISSTIPISDLTEPTSYVYDAITDDDTVEITKTICDSYSCRLTTELDSLTTATTIIDGILTTYVTYVPISSESSSEAIFSAAITTSYDDNDKLKSIPSETATLTEAASSDTPISNDGTATESIYSTTVITTTSCSNNVCSKVPKTTGLTVVTKDNTIYTTYCPFSGEATESETQSSNPSPISSEIEATSSFESGIWKVVTKDNTIYTTFCPYSGETTLNLASGVGSTSSETEVKPTTLASSSLSTINVITDNIVTETPSASFETQSSSHGAVGVSSYEGAAAVAKTTGAFGLLTFFLFLLI